MSSFYSSNIALVKQFHPHTWKTISNLPPEPYGEIVKATNGKPNLKISNKQQDVYLHAEHDPTAEVPQFLDLVAENSTDIVVLQGMGLGYTPLALLKKRPTISHLIIFELEPRIFHQALQNINLSDLLTDPRLILSVSSQPDITKTFAPALHALQHETVNFLKHLPSLNLQEEKYRTLDKKIYNFANERSSVGSTKKKHGKTLLENRFNNLTPIRHHYLLENLKDLYKNIPAIIIAAGPSLDKNIHSLKGIQDKAVIITTDSSLPSLLFHGIEPHFITVIDFQQLTYEKIATSIPKIKNASLIYTPAVGPKVPKIFPAKTTFCAPTDSPIEQWLYSKLGSKESVVDIGTVAHLNLASATTMGCDPIIFVGQDLSYPPVENQDNHVDHAQHCYFGHSGKMFKDKDSLWVKGIDDNMRPTLRDFLAYIKIFERCMAATPRHYINSTAEGAHLAGTEILSLEGTIRRHCLREYDINILLRERLDKAPHPDVNNLMASLDNTLCQLWDLKKSVNKFIPLAQTFRKNCIRLGKSNKRPTSFDELPSSLQKKALALDTLRDEIDHATFFWQILDELTMKDFRHNLQKTQKINNLQDRPDKYTEFITQNSELILHTAKVRKKALITFEKVINQTLEYLQKEKNLLQTLATEEKPPEIVFKLAKLYFASHNFTLAQPLFKKLHKNIGYNTEASFFLGCIAAQQTDHAQAEHLFSHCEDLDPTIKNRISKFREQYANEYWNMAKEFIRIFGKPPKQMLFRGIQHCQNHKKINNELIILADHDLQAIQVKFAEAEQNKAQALVSEWARDLRENTNLSYCLGPEKSAAFYLLNGNRLISEERFEEAESNLETALLLTPDNPEIHLACVNLFFMKNDFTGGVTSLHKAITLNVDYALFWLDIGESMQQADQYKEAIYSYEQAFLAFPDRIEILKKIGDCYLADDQPEAAKEAYEQLKNKVGAQ